MTKIERQKAYFNLAKKIANHLTENTFYICNELKCNTHSLSEFFPEFELFRPDNVYGAFMSFELNRDEISTIESNTRRVMALLLCAEMCND